MLNSMLNDLHQLGSHEVSSPKKTDLQKFFIICRCCRSNTAKPKQPIDESVSEPKLQCVNLRDSGFFSFHLLERNFSSKILQAAVPLTQTPHYDHQIIPSRHSKPLEVRRKKACQSILKSWRLFLSANSSVRLLLYDTPSFNQETNEQTVVGVLLKNGKLPLQAISRQAHLPERVVSESITVLIQHGLVRWANVEDGPTERTYYQCFFEDIYPLVRYGKEIHLTEKHTGLPEVSILQPFSNSRLEVSYSIS